MTRRASQSTLLEHDAQGQPEQVSDMDAIVDVQMTPKTKTVAPRGERGATIPLTGSTASGLEVMPSSPGVSMFERLALDPNVSVDKLERLIAMQERINAANAKAAFDAAFVQMRAFIPVIIERGKTNQTTYAPLEDIIETVTPILSQFGFSLSFRTEWPGDRTIRVIGILTHAQGSTRESMFESGADKSGSKNDIQALASAVTYGKRYATNDLLCIVTRGEDKDGQRPKPNGAAVSPVAAVPAGFEAWRLDLQATADEGTERLKAAWEDSPVVFRSWLTLKHADSWMALKARAVKAGGR